MPQTVPAPSDPAERLAVRIVKLANTPGDGDIGPVIAETKRRRGTKPTDAAIKVAIEKGWLRPEGPSYSVTPAGVELGVSRAGKRTRRVMPF